MLVVEFIFATGAASAVSIMSTVCVIEFGHEIGFYTDIDCLGDTSCLAGNSN